MGRKKQDLQNMRFGRWRVLHELPGSGNVRWQCECDCGATRGVTSSNLIGGQSTSCGCWKDEKTVARSTIHGLVESGAYTSWRGMIERCHNENADKFSYYGGRGITVCQRWRESFKAFHDDMGDRPCGMTIDRIDPDGNYELRNCRWATWKQQSANKRSGGAARQPAV